MKERFKNASGGMVIDGIAASEAIDSSGEVLDVEGCDITDLKDGKAVLNWEHRGDDAVGASPLDVVGRICFAKKLFEAKDCSNERERMYWKMCKGVPMIYMIARLYDAAGHPGAQAMAAQIRDHVKNDEKVLIRFSIEGSTLEKKGNILKESVARRVAATIKPCNRTCDSGVLEDPQSPWGDGKKPGGDDLIDSILSRSERADPLLRPLGGAMTVVCNPILDVKKSSEEAIVRLLVLQKLQKTLAAGAGGCAPGALTQGAALQREDSTLRKWRETAVTALREHRPRGTSFNKGEFRAVLKAKLPDADESFLDHFTDLADEFHVKKSEALTKMTARARSAKGKAAAAEPAAAIPAPAKAPPQLDMFAPAGNTPHEPVATPQAKDPQSIKVGREVATLRGRPVPANPSITAPVFDEQHGVLHTPRGSFPLYIPGRDTPSEGESFNNILNDPKVTQFHDYAMNNWARANGFLRAGQLPEELVMHGTLFSQLSPNCLDAETEALTQRGWVKGFDLTMDDVLLTKNPKTGRAEWQKPTDLRFFPDYEGPLVEFKSRSFHAVTTPDHRWLVTTGRGHVREETSATITDFNDKIHRTAEYIYDGKSGLTPDEAEVLGWFVTDGSIGRAQNCNGSCVGRAHVRYDPPGVYARIHQSTTGNPEKCARIEALLQRVASDEVCSHVAASGSKNWTLGPRLTKLMLERSPERFLTTSSLLDLDRPALERLYEVMVLGDGSAWLGKEEWQEKETLVTGREEQADAFQILLTLLGFASSKTWRDMSMYEPKSDKMQNVPKMTGCYVVTKLQRKYVRIEPQHRREYTAKVGVWCPVVPNTFFFMRRDGHTCTTGNTPVPIQELMYGHLVDMMRETGVDPRSPDFGSHKEDYTRRDRPDRLPVHSRDYFQGLGEAVRIGRQKPDGQWTGPTSATGREPGDVQSFMLANNKFANMAKYHTLHQALVGLVNKHRDDARSGVAELMKHKMAAARHGAIRSRALAAGRPDPGPYAAGPDVPGLAPKTARYMWGMLGGGNVVVPDTHFSRHLFGFDKAHDMPTIDYMKKVLWDPNNTHVLDGIDRYYAAHHPVVKHMREHPRFAGLFPSNDAAVFPAFWKHWVAISPHEKSRGMASFAHNLATDHRPYWEAIDPYLMARKSEARAWDVPQQTAAMQHRWIAEYGEVPALMLHFRFNVPKLLAAAKERESRGV